MQPIFAAIVEGEGEESALRPLIHNIIASGVGGEYPTVMPPYRVHWGTIVNKPDELAYYAQMALREAGNAARLLVLLDADGRCPAELGPRLLQQLEIRFPSVPISVTVADWEYESWFIASAESIARHTGTTNQIEVPDNIEAIKAAKGWVERNLMADKYKERKHQAAFSTRINVSLARSRSHSFNRFCREIERLLTG